MIGINNIPLFKEIRQYNHAINIPAPEFEEIDIRRFEENMKTVPAVMPPFRNRFYQIALVMDADGHVGQNHLLHNFKNCTLFFNTPGQILKWDIIKNWRGYYISFKSDFISLSFENPVTLHHYPFFRHEAKKFFDLNEQEALILAGLFEKMLYEYSQPSIYNMTIIQSYLNVILTYGKRFYEREKECKKTTESHSPLIHRFEMLLEEMFKPVSFGMDVVLKSVSEIARELHVSPKYLSEVLKEETGKTAVQHIHHRVIDLAKALLKNTSLSIGEIAYQLGFENPPYFTRLFKNQTGQSPSAFRGSR